MTQRHALAQLIDQIEAANNWKDTDVAQRARAAGHRLSKSNISRIRNEPVTRLNPAQVHGLAAGLGITPSQVALTTLASMGIHVVQEPNSVEDAVRRDVMLSEREKKLLLSILGQMHADRKAGGS